MTHRRPLVEALKNFQQQRPVSFHVPGHKHGELSGLPDEIRPALQYDQTELSGLDDLHYPDGPIRKAQELLSEAYGADQSFFLVNGSTSGNLAMIHAVCKEGDRVLVQRNSHKSIFHALELARVRPVYLAPGWGQASQSAEGISLETVKEALRQYPDAKALILTYPNYYGMARTETEDIISYCHQFNIPVLVDEAHGAHLLAGQPFPQSALSLGADVVVQSAHKTLPAMTMGSYLHIQGTRINAEKIRKYLRMFQSSSPSYLIMASLDDARAYIQTYSSPDMQYFEEKRRLFISSLQTIAGLAVFEADDPLKIMLRVEGHNGFKLQKKLEEMNVYVELADIRQVLMVLPLLKQGHIYPFAEIRSRIREAVQKLRKEQVDPKIMMAPQETTVISEPEISCEAIDLADKEWISYTKAMGRYSAAMVTPYPPGIPLAVPGEVWTHSKLERLLDHLAAGAMIQGEHNLAEKQLFVIQHGGVK
ncbi:aminotransferase class I/II-fold pyridoxal phosphate-dependent enzyme [Planococcus salinarum]|nr:aminotransferase class I/II-fold pyridoxal phosphate-dependent enzyme [Planococcus salinarum]TAA69715.1 aminotransferase class I/II-fold pyridoxal phosphate-dependent enzyme [Planococcus salinarum]